MHQRNGEVLKFAKRLFEYSLKFTDSTMFAVFNLPGRREELRRRARGASSSIWIFTFTRGPLLHLPVISQRGKIRIHLFISYWANLLQPASIYPFRGSFTKDHIIAILDKNKRKFQLHAFIKYQIVSFDSIVKWEVQVGLVLFHN